MPFAKITRGTGTDFSAVGNGDGEFDYLTEWDTESAVDMPASVLESSGDGIEIPAELDGELWEVFCMGDYAAHSSVPDGRFHIWKNGGASILATMQYDNYALAVPQLRSGLIQVSTGDTFGLRARIFTGSWTLDDDRTHLALVDDQRAGFLSVSPSGDTNSTSDTFLIWGTPVINTLDATVSGTDVIVPSGVQGMICSINHRNATVNSGNGNFVLFNDATVLSAYNFDAQQERAPANGLMGVFEVSEGDAISVRNIHVSTPGVDASEFSFDIEWLP